MIGVFDSGSGGLSVLYALRQRLPSVDVLYFGDIRNAPYGTRTHEELSALTVDALRLLAKRGASRIVSACNSVSATLALSLVDALELAPSELIEMVGPTVAYMRGEPGKALVLATPATVRAGMYRQAFRMAGKEAEEVAIPELAAAIEFGASEEELERIIREALARVAPDSFGSVLLACTHYPLALPVFRRVLGKDARIVDPALIVAERIERQWWPKETGEGRTRFLISKDSEPFRRYVARWFPKDAENIEVLQ
ncbi:MAG: aspartate/glutamate racemase family protein [Patescibacteria group bacterium]|nr:aspartate/glutamate racemase family protein [Patescibacteria group bacterium]MDE1966322.1 aspartate/glutamate racemase family protein [Patescibacteria group bacterium]